MSVRILSIADVTNEVACGRVLSTGLTHRCLQRIGRLNNRVNAVVTQNPHSLSDARLMDESSAREKILLGLPFSVKDAFETAGIKTTSSHKPLMSYVPSVNAVAVDRLLNAGGVLLGKTNLPELAADLQCRSPLFGVTNNPWDLLRTSGGSCGGSAVAVALGFSWLDLGSDLAGSIRIPASFCGVVGFKATERRIPGDGHIPPLPRSTSTVRHMLSFGLLTRRVEDAGIGLRVLTSSEHRSSNRLTDVHGNHSIHGGDRLKFAFWDDFDGIPLCSRTRKALYRAVTDLARAGHMIERKCPDGFDFESILNAFGTIAGAEVGFVSNSLVRTVLSGLASFPAHNQSITRGLLAGLSTKPIAYENALRVRHKAIDQLELLLDTYDAWIIPTTPCVAYPHLRRLGLSGIAKIRFEGYSLPYLEGNVGLTALFSLTGSPVLSIPCPAIDGLPVGLQFVGRRMQDQHLIDACKLVENIIGGYQPPPLLRDELTSDFISTQ